MWLSLFSFTSKIKNNLRLNSDRNINYNLRNKNFFTTTSTELNMGKKTAEYFFSRFLNGLYVNQLQVKFISFKTYDLNNLSIFLWSFYILVSTIWFKNLNFSHERCFKKNQFVTLFFPLFSLLSLIFILFSESIFCMYFFVYFNSIFLDHFIELHCISIVITVIFLFIISKLYLFRVSI